MIQPLLLSALKATLLSGAGLLLLGAFSSQMPALRRRAGLAALWSLLLLPWITLGEVTISVSSSAEPSSAHDFASWLLPPVLGLWICGTLWRLLRLALEMRSLSRTVKNSTRHGKTALAPIRFAEGLSSPCIWGIMRPVILMPTAAAHWPAAAWRAALAHEEQHLRQNDGLHRLITALIRAVFWWNPLVHALCRRLELESELCCDEAASRGTGRRAYGELLLSLATGASFETAAAWNAAGGGLRERLHHLLAPMPHGRPWWQQPVKVVAMLGALLLAAACCFTPKASLLYQEAETRLAANPFPEE